MSIETMTEDGKNLIIIVKEKSSIRFIKLKEREAPTKEYTQCLLGFYDTLLDIIYTPSGHTIEFIEKTLVPPSQKREKWDPIPIGDLLKDHILFIGFCIETLLDHTSLQSKTIDGDDYDFCKLSDYKVVIFNLFLLVNGTNNRMLNKRVIDFLAPTFMNTIAKKAISEGREAALSYIFSVIELSDELRKMSLLKEGTDADR